MATEDRRGANGQMSKWQVGKSASMQAGKAGRMTGYKVRADSRGPDAHRGKFLSSHRGHAILRAAVPCTTRQKVGTGNRGVAQFGQRARFGSVRSAVQVRPPRQKTGLPEKLVDLFCCLRSGHKSVFGGEIRLWSIVCGIRFVSRSRICSNTLVL
jgi:hypothetical protein